MTFSVAVKKGDKYKVVITFDSVVQEVLRDAWFRVSGDSHICPRWAKFSDLSCSVAEVDRKAYIGALCADWFVYKHYEVDWGKYKPKLPDEPKGLFDITSTYPCKLTVREIFFEASKLLIYVLYYLVEEDTIILRDDYYWDMEELLRKLEEEVKRDPSKLEDQEFVEYFDDIKRTYEFFKECVKKHAPIYEEKGRPITANELGEELRKVRETLKAKGIKVNYARAIYDIFDWAFERG